MKIGTQCKLIFWLFEWFPSIDGFRFNVIHFSQENITLNRKLRYIEQLFNGEIFEMLITVN